MNTLTYHDQYSRLYLEILQQGVDVLLAAVPSLACLHPLGGIGRPHVALARVLLEKARVQGDL